MVRRPVRASTATGVVAVVLALVGLLAACSSDGPKDASPRTTTTKADAAGGEQAQAADAIAERLGAIDPAAPEGERRPPVTLSVTAATDAPTGAGATANGARAMVPGPTRLTGSTTSGWHTIDRSPTKPKGGTDRTFPGGTRQSLDGDDPDAPIITRNPDGSTDFNWPDGSVSRLDPDGSVTDIPATGPDGGDDPAGPGDSYDMIGPDGTQTHVGPDGIWERSPDGTITNYDPDDGTTVVPPPTHLPPDAGGGKPPSGAIGEPHYLTEDGASVTSQRLGEFVLSTGVAGQEVQARTQPWKKSPTAAAISALAFGVGDQRVQIDIDGTVLVDGQPSPRGAEQEFGFTQGGAVGVYRAEGDDTGPVTDLVLVWPDLSAAWVTVHDGWLDLRTQWSAATGARRGLLGSDDGNVQNELALRDGTVADEDGVDDVVRSWYLTPEESRFTYADGLTTESYRDDAFPQTEPTPDLASADDACADVPEGFAREACRYDVGLTGVDVWVASSLAFGTAAAADDARQAALTWLGQQVATLWTDPSSDDTTTTTGGGPTTTTTEPADDLGALALRGTDRDDATDTPIDGRVDAELTTGETAVYHLVVTASSQVYALNNDLSCPKEPWKVGQPGYAYFALDGSVVIPPARACDDSAKAVLPAGEYYLKLVGPATFSLDLDAIPAG